MKDKLPPDHRQFLELVTASTESNPFGAERVDLESQLTGQSFTTDPLNLSNWEEWQKRSVEIARRLDDCLTSLSKEPRSDWSRFPREDRILLRNGVWIWIYTRYREALDQHVHVCGSNPDQEPRVGNEIFKNFRADLSSFFRLVEGPGYRDEPLSMNEVDIADVFAFCFQLRRGFLGIVRRIVGVSPCIAQLRESVWESIFTRRLLWSFQYLKDRMANFSTLILGKSGTGKDLVAEAIGTSQFIPYLPREDRFALNFTQGYRAVNLSALTPTLIEAELFGHAKGAFTGAGAASKGHLELCSEYGALFLDEIGDLSPEIQVKLLRVLQSREFYPLGERTPRYFKGRILSATNRELPALVAEGRMREDFLYRIGATVIRVPPLQQRLEERADEASVLLPHFLEKALGHVDAEVLADLEQKIGDLISSGYPWPGNVREFEQCVRTLLVASDYDPPVGERTERSVLGRLLQRMERAEVSLDEVIRGYCRHAIRLAGSYQEASRRLDADWRTVRKYAMEEDSGGTD